MKGRFLFLGSGGSLGVPVVGCKCAVCTSDSPQNKRTRPSGLVTIAGKKLLIDAGPDFRRQALRHKLESLDGLLLTHTHFDHIAGVDELRIFSFLQKIPVPCLMSGDTHEEIALRYHYLINPKSDYATTKLVPHILKEDFGEMNFLGIPIQFFSYQQAGMKVTGYRFGNFAYVTDIQDYDENVLLALEGVDILVLSALRWTKSPVHFSLPDALAFAEKVQAKKTWLTHIAHDLDYKETNEKLPPHVQLSYDGLEIEFELGDIF